MPEHTVFVITTDGAENASRRYSPAQVKDMIEERKKDGWEFLFLGANIDAIETASCLGIDSDRAVDYRADSVGTQISFCAMSDAICRVRKNRDIDYGWKSEIEADFKSRQN